MKCSIEDCFLPAKKRGWCENHYARWYRKGTMDLRAKTEVQCKKEGCEELTTSATGFCLTHYKQAHYLNGVGRTELIVRTTKGRWIHCTTGYVMIKVDGKLTYEHRHLAEKALGRPLPKGAVVHHVDAPDDNHGFCKLVVCPSQEYHALLHTRMYDAGY